MKKIVIEQNIVEFIDFNESLFVADHNNAISFYFFGNENEMLVTKEDYILFDATRRLYENVMAQSQLNEQNELNKKTIFKRHKRRELFRNNKIEIHSTYEKKDKENTMYISKVDDDTFKYLFFIEDKSYPGVSVNYDILSKKDIYEPYTIYFREFYNTLYNLDLDYHQMNLEEYEYTLKLKK